METFSESSNVTLRNLKPNSTYRVMVKTMDIKRNSFESDPLQFKTGNFLKYLNRNKT